MSDTVLPNADEHLRRDELGENMPDRLVPAWDEGDCHCEPPSALGLPDQANWECPACGRRWRLQAALRLWDPEVLADALQFERDAVTWAQAVDIAAGVLPVPGEEVTDDGR